MKLSRIAPSAIAALALGAVLVACSSTPAENSSTPAAGSSASADSTEIVPADIVVGVGGQLSNTDVFAAVQDGFFADEGLTATTQVLTAGSNAIPQLLSGELTFATVDTTTAINATQQDVGITTVATNTVGIKDDTGYGMIVAGADSGIATPKDLEGKKVQVNALGGTAQVLTQASVQKDGGDPSKVQFVEIAPPQAIAALQAGQVDAAVLSEPNVTAAKALGFTAVFNPEQNTVPGLPTFVFVTSTAFAEQNPQVVRQFQRAILAANQALVEDPEQIRTIAATSTQVPADVLADIAGLPQFGTEQITGDQVQQYIDLLVEFGALESDAVPTGDQVVWAG